MTTKEEKETIKKIVNEKIKNDHFFEVLKRRSTFIVIGISQLLAVVTFDFFDVSLKEVATQVLSFFIK